MAGIPQPLAEARHALARNELQRADALLRAHLERHPADPDAIRLLAELAARIGRDEDACALLERCLRIAPGYDAARQQYARLLYRADRPAEALAQVGILLDRDPRNPAYRHLKAIVLARTGDYAEAAALFEGLNTEYPDHGAAWVSQGHALKAMGESARAIAAYRRCTEIEPEYGDAWWGLANLKTFRFGDADLATMRAQLARPDLDGEDRTQLCFALGKALEDRAEYASAFESYAQGNALRRGRVAYSADENTARLRHAAGIHADALFREREGQGCPAPDPVFVVGMPRAGSTLVEQILASHPLVEGTMELPDMPAIARSLWFQAGGGRPGAPDTSHDVVARLDAEGLRAAGERYIERTRAQRRTGAPFFVDKMPNNFAHAGLIRLALPNAKIVDVRRDPMACGFSVFKQYFAAGQDFSYDLGDIGRYYRDYVEYMAHFDRVQPGRILRIAYEDLVADTESQVRRLLDYCGLPFDAACLRFFESGRAVRTPSAEQVRQPIYRHGLDAWKHFAPWLGPLRNALGPVAGA
jgi:tetratricopeptide (TPR) repeat protein